MALERMRLAHEEAELLERAMYVALADAERAASNRKASTAHRAAHRRVKAYAAAYAERADALATMYQDTDGERANELAAMADSLAPFDARFAELTAYHRQHPSSAENEPYEAVLLRDVLAAAPEPAFHGEEAEGRYVDMHELHEDYLNLKGAARVDYVAYLRCAPQLAELPAEAVRTGAYARYVAKLRAYWEGFLRRSQPLMPLDELLQRRTDDFSEKWARGEVIRWQGSGGGGGGAGGRTAAAESVYLDGVNDVAELESLGLERLKEELSRRGLKCGGTQRARAERLFAVRGLAPEAMPKELRAKSTAAAGCASSSSADSNHRRRAVALNEELAMHAGELLTETLGATAEMIEKKQARTYDEIARDLAAADEEVGGDLTDASSSEDEDRAAKPIYNPRNLPLGWDGKPIPFWLYKLHGLSKEFVCEICGNTSFFGPKAFERHFAEGRHARGMECLGIPNTRHFWGVTKIDDAYALWSKVRSSSRGLEDASSLMEVEDASGNVMSARTYDDLRRQGLL